MPKAHAPSFLARTWKMAAAGASSMGLLVGAIVIMAPVLRSDAAPWSGVSRYAQLEGNVRNLTQQLQQSQSQLTQTNLNLDLVTASLLQQDLDRLEKENASLQDRRALIDKINAIRLRIGLPPIARP